MQSILVYDAAERRTQKKHVRFDESTQLWQLPEEEWYDAWMARFGLWRPAPYHDELWDGDLKAVREVPLSKEALDRINRELWFRRHSLQALCELCAEPQGQDPGARKQLLEEINEEYERIMGGGEESGTRNELGRLSIVEMSERFLGVESRRQSDVGMSEDQKSAHLVNAALVQNKKSLTGRASSSCLHRAIASLLCSTIEPEEVLI